ncbi:MAG TPA: class F sortase [Candidatus Paceibacterota bacterium]|jgi:LPXTG-site transpeptidase (sortase) family protein|nr:class F sortase [Candidatus Paceibacterota bacterium]
MRKRPIAFLLFLLSFAVFGMTLARATLYAPTDDQHAPANVAEAATAPTTVSAPTRLSIPSIGVDANVQQVGLTSAGDMGVPSNFTDVAWYKYGPLPGTPGSAVIDGHVDNGLSLPGVFKHLDQIRAGDSIYVMTQSGQQLHFVVQSTQRYPYDAVPKEQLFAKSDTPRLNLITCSGTWMPNSKTYDTRLVVYTTLAP